MIGLEHEWVDGECNHGPLVENERDKPVLDKNSKALEALRRVVIDPRFLKSLHQYVTFIYVPLGMKALPNKALKFNLVNYTLQMGIAT